jgi:hypothetical protein
MSKILFDHTYTYDSDFIFLEKLKHLGFTQAQRVTEHPGAICKFIYFNDKKYLEFVHPTEESSFCAPGLSLKYDGPLIDLYKRLIKKGAPVVYKHRNYNWKENDTDHLPGWNFLSFKKWPLKTMYLWFTENESSPDSRKVPIKMKNPNSLNIIHGHEFSINKIGREIFELYLGKKLKDKIELGNETVFYFKEGKTNYHNSVILKFENIKKSLSFLREDRIFDEKSCRLINPSDSKRMWDLKILL